MLLKYVKLSMCIRAWKLDSNYVRLQADKGEKVSGKANKEILVSPLFIRTFPVGHSASHGGQL